MWTTLLVALVVVALSFFAWKKFSGKAGAVDVPKPQAAPRAVEPPVDPQPEEEEKEGDEDEEDEAAPVDLVPDIKAAFSEDDWALLLANAVEERVEKNTNLMTEDEPNSDIYRLTKGEIQIYHRRNGQRQVLRTVSQAGYVFGEMTAISNMMRATASVDASADSKMLRLSNTKLMEVFEDNYALSIRFHRYIGNMLGLRLAEVNRVSKGLPVVPLATEEAKAEKKKVFTRRKELDLEALNKKAHKRFPILPATQILARKCTVVLVRDGSKRAGTLYVFPAYLAFFSKIFGMVHKQIIPLRDISNVSHTEKRPKYFIDFQQVTDVVGEDEPQVTAIKLILLRPDDNEFMISHLSNHKAAADGLVNDAPPESCEEGDTALSRRMTADDWAIILTEDPHSLVREYEEGDVIIEAGSFTPCVFQMVSGAADVIVGGSIVGNIGTGDLFGEIAFLTKETAGASVIATCRTSCYVIDGKRINGDVLREHPYTVERFYHYLITVLIKRLTKRERYVRQ